MSINLQEDKATSMSILRDGQHVVFEFRFGDSHQRIIMTTHDARIKLAELAKSCV